MKQALCGFILAALAASCGGQGQDEGWIDLSGSFDGWNQVGDANWRIENGEFVADSGSGFLATQDSFADFQLQLEFWTDEGANSGVFMRLSEPERITPNNSYEVNIFDTRPDQTYRTGAIVNHAPPLLSIDTANQWNDYDITARGTRLTVRLNDMITVDADNDAFSAGPLALQYGSGTVKFRNVRIRPLNPE